MLGSIYHMTIKFFCNCDFGIKRLYFAIICDVVMGVIS